MTVVVLGFGRSGKATTLALREGGATVVVWHDCQPARDADGVEGPGDFVNIYTDRNRVNLLHFCMPHDGNSHAAGIMF